ncbi:hypothetical protein BDV96DRAFT_587811 [Lophiotrema nucula]|uniref:Uncharacterized protein n=1 Tax=Lophiotrema nucula TaxID=690887 RepID=A0A6A5YMB7_9PLEO|nr:hypothetical protein BDV96DRAFT_587811 [Lophiotrema nucula]
MPGYSGPTQAQGQISAAGVYMSISFLPYTKFDYHNQKNLGPLADPREGKSEELPYTFYVSDYVIDPLGEPEMGVLVHGGKDCAGLAQSMSTHDANIVEPSPGNGVDGAKAPGTWFPKLKKFKLVGGNGKICGLTQDFTFTEYTEDDTFYWWDGITSSATGYCDVIKDASYDQCNTSDGAEFQTSRVMACVAYGSPNYCQNF